MDISVAISFYFVSQVSIPESRTPALAGRDGANFYISFTFYQPKTIAITPVRDGAIDYDLLCPYLRVLIPLANVPIRSLRSIDLCGHCPIVQMVIAPITVARVVYE